MVEDKSIPYTAVSFIGSSNGTEDASSQGLACNVAVTFGFSKGKHFTVHSPNTNRKQISVHSRFSFTHFLK